MLPTHHQSKVTVIRRTEAQPQTSQLNPQQHTLQNSQVLEPRVVTRTQERLSYAPSNRVVVAQKVDYKYSLRQDDMQGLGSSTDHLKLREQTLGLSSYQPKEERPSMGNMSYRSIDNRYGLVVRKMERPSTMATDSELYHSSVFPSTRHFEYNEPLTMQTKFIESNTRLQNFTTGYFNKEEYSNEQPSFETMARSDRFIFQRLNAGQYKTESEYALQPISLGRQEQELDIPNSLVKSSYKQDEVLDKSSEVVYEPTVIVTDGGKYIGDVIEGRINGQGTLYNSNDVMIYEGSFKDDMFDGYGVLFNLSPDFSQAEEIGDVLEVGPYEPYKDLEQIGTAWAKYEGIFKEDKKHKIGFWYLKCDDIFLGEFSDDKANGHGVYTCTGGRIIVGIWKNNRLVEIL